jgi:HEAT repeat protein
MAIRFLLRGGIYILFVIGVVAGWLLKRRQRDSSSQGRAAAPDHTAEPANALQHPQWQMRLQAVRQIAGQREQNNLPLLLPMLNDQDSDVREAAIEAVAVFGASALPDLFIILREGQLHSREAAARLCGLAGDLAAVPMLTDALNDESAWVRLQAAHSLGRLGSASAARALDKSLQTETDSAVRQAIQSALAVLTARD